VGWGYQIERFQASNYFLVYAFICSLPFFSFLLFFILSNNRINIIFLTKPLFVFYVVLLLPFIAKLPFFFLHLWLPKAHVEAPTRGSIILAAILLKIGGFGIIRVLIMLKIQPIFILSVAFLGFLVRSLTCCFQSDRKSFIAYSSVAHINFILVRLFTFFSKREKIRTMVIMSHGFISGFLFFSVGLLFYITLTRSIYFSRFSFSIFFIPFLVFTLILLANFGVPPFVSSVREIIRFSLIFKFAQSFFLFLLFYAFIVCYFCIFLLLVVLHGKLSWAYKPLYKIEVIRIRGFIIVFLVFNLIIITLIYRK
jgi:NADH-ubiquinone oxidoreductase chain 4